MLMKMYRNNIKLLNKFKYYLKIIFFNSNTNSSISSEVLVSFGLDSV